jgi:hypothetical protein
MLVLTTLVEAVQTRSPLMELQKERMRMGDQRVLEALVEAWTCGLRLERTLSRMVDPRSPSLCCLSTT